MKVGPLGGGLPPAPYELRLDERPGDRERFNAIVDAIIWRSKPGGTYRIPLFIGGRKKRTMELQWASMMRALAGNAYELGRRDT